MLLGAIFAVSGSRCFVSAVCVCVLLLFSEIYDFAMPKKRTKRVPKANKKLFNVEAIRGKRIDEDEIYYLIKWKGYEESENSWEPITALTYCLDMLREYDEEQIMKTSPTEFFTPIQTVTGARAAAPGDIIDFLGSLRLVVFKTGFDETYKRSRGFSS